MITSASNPKLKQIDKLLSKKKYRYETGQFICEGRRIVRDIPHQYISEIYIAQSRVDDISTLFERNGLNCAVEIVADALLEKVSDTKHSQGVLAVVRMPEYVTEDLFGGGQKSVGADTVALKAGRVDVGEPFLLFLENVADPGNLGTIFRVAEAAGVTGIVMTRQTVDVFSPKVVRATMSSIFRMPFVYMNDLASVMEDIRQAGGGVYAAALGGEELYEAEGFCKPVGIVLGNEAHGVSEETIKACDGAVRIPMCGKIESLNVAMAAGVISYEIFRQRRNGP